jgi:hypothetical protein
LGGGGGGGAGATAACEAADDAGACSTGGELVCATVADCPAGDECVARGGGGLGDAGGGTMVCRVARGDAGFVRDATVGD